MGHPSFGPMWPSKNPNIVTLVRSDGLRLPIHRELADLVSMLMDLTELGGYDIRPDWTWGYANRAIRGTQKPSNHSQGTATDINAPANPQSVRFISDMPDWMVKLWKDFGFRWGGDYRPPTKYDPMHFEFLPGSVADARAHTKRLRQFLADNGNPAPEPPQPIPEPEDIDMLIVSNPATPAYLITGGNIAHLDTMETFRGLLAAGVKHAIVTEAQIAKFRRDLFHDLDKGIEVKDDDESLNLGRLIADSTPAP